MKKSLILSKKHWNFKVRFSKRISTRLSRKFWFFKKYFYRSLYIKNFFLKFKKHYYFTFNLFLYFFYFNWLRCFSLKYYDMYLEDPIVFNLKLLPTLPKQLWHIGYLQKFFFFKSSFFLLFPVYFWNISLVLKFNCFFLQYYYYYYLQQLYFFFLKCLILISIKKKLFVN